MAFPPFFEGGLAACINTSLNLEKNHEKCLFSIVANDPSCRYGFAECGAGAGFCKQSQYIIRDPARTTPSVPKASKPEEQEFLVFFVNGINNSERDARDSRDELEKTIKKHFVNECSVYCVYNDSTTSVIQNSNHPVAPVIQSLGDSIVGVLGAGADALGAALKDVECWQPFSKSVYERMGRDIAWEIKKHPGKTVVFVPHSEGNIYVMTLLWRHEEVRMALAHDSQDRKVIAVASPVNYGSQPKVRYIINKRDILYPIFLSSTLNQAGIGLIDQIYALWSKTTGWDLSGVDQWERKYTEPLKRQELLQKSIDSAIIRTKNDSDMSRFEVHAFGIYLETPEFIDALEWAGFTKKSPVNAIRKVIYERFRIRAEFFCLSDGYSDIYQGLNNKIERMRQVLKLHNAIDYSSCPDDFQLAFSEWKKSFERYGENSIKTTEKCIRKEKAGTHHIRDNEDEQLNAEYDTVKSDLKESWKRLVDCWWKYEEHGIIQTKIRDEMNDKIMQEVVIPYKGKPYGRPYDMPSVYMMDCDYELW